MAMRTILLAAAVLAVACGPKSKPVEDDTLPDPGSDSPGDSGTGDDEPEPPATELEARKYAACEKAGPRLTECAIEDARANMSPKEFAELDVEKTGPVHTREFIKKCSTDELSSRQVRVYEVCIEEETECAPLMACLANLNTPE